MYFNAFFYCRREREENSIASLIFLFRVAHPRRCLAAEERTFLFGDVRVKIVEHFIHKRKGQSRTVLKWQELLGRLVETEVFLREAFELLALFGRPVRVRLLVGHEIAQKESLVRLGDMDALDEHSLQKGEIPFDRVRWTLIGPVGNVEEELQRIESTHDVRFGLEELLGRRCLAKRLRTDVGDESQVDKDDERKDDCWFDHARGTGQREREREQQTCIRRWHL